VNARFRSETLTQTNFTDVSIVTALDSSNRTWTLVAASDGADMIVTPAGEHLTSRGHDWTYADDDAEAFAAFLVEAL
jgi:hypothetical protein